MREGDHVPGSASGGQGLAVYGVFQEVENGLKGEIHQKEDKNQQENIRSQSCKRGE
jgi:hypothetical protein